MKFNWTAFVNALVAALLAGLTGGVTAVSFKGCNGGSVPPPPQTCPVPPPDAKPAPPEAKPDALNAIGRIAMNGGFCSGTVVAPRLADGRWHIVTAAHVENGQVLAAPNRDEQIRYRLSVSPGDSGGGIMTDASGRLLSPVCCTTCLGCPGDVWGASPTVIKRMIAKPTEFVDLLPVAMPPPPKE